MAAVRCVVLADGTNGARPLWFPVAALLNDCPRSSCSGVALFEMRARRRRGNGQIVVLYYINSIYGLL